KYVSPPFAGMTPMALAAQSFDRYYGKRSDWMTEEGQLHYVEEAAKCRYLDTFWLDAGWFREGFPNGLGNYSFPSGFPNGLKPVSEKAHANGMRMLVWFEPERVLTGSDVWNQHRDWLLESGEPWMRDRGMYLFNLGNDEAREWMTQNLIRFIRDNGIDVYRQDFNMSPLAYWRMNDAPGRRGYLENRHVAGLYRMMDDLLAAIPGLVIDNCSSGGRRLDFEMNRRSVPMWRSDTGCFPRSDRYHTETFNQNQVIGLTRYLVWHASSSWDTKAVSMRSSATDGLGCEFPFLDPEMDFEEARKALAETASLRRYWQGDFTPLVDEAYLRRNGPVAEDRWVGWQLSLKDEGFALFFRRCACEEDSACFSLTAIEEDAVYRIVLSDEQRNKTERTVRGSELAHDFRVTSPEKMSSVLMLYRKAETV
ncbi:MAG: alpha-galactosidase, partial [Clostridia bacterium]|nr:alpha-galactosidase [Clostridia bacterium]